MKGVLPWLVRWAYCANTRDFCPAMAAQIGTVKKDFSSPYTISIHLSPSHSNRAGSRVVSPVSLYVSLFGLKKMQISHTFPGRIFDPKRKIQCMLPHYIIYILSLSPPLLRIFMMDLSTSSS
jgi:hypothetical protein